MDPKKVSLKKLNLAEYDLLRTLGAGTLFCLRMVQYRCLWTGKACSP